MDEEDGREDDEEVGGLFTMARHRARGERKATSNELDCSVFRLSHIQDWNVEEVRLNEIFCHLK